VKRLIIVDDQGPHRHEACTWYLVEEQERTRFVDQFGRTLRTPERYRPLVATVTFIPENGLSRGRCAQYAATMARSVDVELAAKRVLDLWDDQYSHSADEEERSVWSDLRDALEREVGS